MPWDRKRLLGYVEIIQFILGVTDKMKNISYFNVCEARRLLGNIKNS